MQYEENSCFGLHQVGQLSSLKAIKFKFKTQSNTFCDLCWVAIMKLPRLEEFCSPFPINNNHLQDIFNNLKSLKVLKFNCDKVRDPEERLKE